MPYSSTTEHGELMDDDLEAIRRKRMEDLKNAGTTNWPSEPVKLSDADFDAFVAKYPIVVVDCWAPWCGPCRMVAPVVDALAKEWTGKVVFGKLNTDENADIPGKYRISAIPTILVFKGGKLAETIVGAYPKEPLAAKIKKHM